jgi:hypothetical protein
MRTVEGFKTTIIGAIIVDFKNELEPGDYEKLEKTADHILKLFAEELTRTAWKNIRKEYRNKLS